MCGRPAGTAESRALTMRGEGGGGLYVLRIPPMHKETAHEWGIYRLWVTSGRLVTARGFLRLSRAGWGHTHSIAYYIFADWFQLSNS